MSTELFRLAAELCRPLGPEKDEPKAEPTAVKAAREIIAEHPDWSVEDLVAWAWCDGGLRALEMVRNAAGAARVAEYDRICSRCGKRDGSVFLAEPPADGFVQSVCFDCSAGDEP